ncbi:MAG: FHA domain-containing protein [Microthrixaceae bacterium]|nr:FHA domain-containing protein [Microthrixaceae bacterium]
MQGIPTVEIHPPDGGPLCIVVNRRFELGRECDGVLIDDAMLSRRHLAIQSVGDQVTIEDLGSRNGTLLGGSPLAGTGVLGPGVEAVAGQTRIRRGELIAAKPAVAEGSRTAHRETVAPGSPTRTSGTGEAAPSPVSGRDARSTMIEAVAHDVASKAGSLADSLPDTTGGTLTFLFSDIESSTQMAEALGDNVWFDHLRRHNELIENQVRAHRGRVIKSIGDGYMVTFNSAGDAIRCATAVQKGFESPEFRTPGQQVRVRMGLHTGEAVEAGGDLFGLHVNVAARVANQAAGGQVLVSGLTRAITEPSGDFSFGPESQVELKGLSGTHGVSELRWQQAGGETPSGDSRATTVVRPD